MSVNLNPGRCRAHNSPVRLSFLIPNCQLFIKSAFSYTLRLGIVADESVGICRIVKLGTATSKVNTCKSVEFGDKWGSSLMEYSSIYRRLGRPMRYDRDSMNTKIMFDVGNQMVVVINDQLI